MIIGIMAATKAGIIGYKNSLPWDYKDELEHFKRTTDNCTIIMGRKTYDGLPKHLLKTRKGIVFSRNLNFKAKDAAVVNSLEDFKNKYGKICDTAPASGEFASGHWHVKNLLQDAVYRNNFKSCPNPSLRGSVSDRGNPYNASKEVDCRVGSCEPPRNDNLNFSFTTGVYMIGGAEIAHLFLSNNLLNFFILTVIKYPYAGDVTLNLNYFNDWDKKLLQPAEDYDIYLLTNNNKR